MRIRTSDILFRDIYGNLLQSIPNITIDFFTEKIAGGADHLLDRDLYLSLGIQMQITSCILIHSNRIKLPWLLKCLHVIDHINNLFRRTKDS